MERYPNLKEEVGGSIPGYEISSLLDRYLALACRPSVSKKEKKRKHMSVDSLTPYICSALCPGRNGD